MDISPVIQELTQALCSDFGSSPPSISPDILRMFVRDADYIASPKKDGSGLPLDKSRVLEKFALAQNLYKKVWNNGVPLASFAVFYRIEDKKSLASEINRFTWFFYTP